MAGVLAAAIVGLSAPVSGLEQAGQAVPAECPADQGKALAGPQGLTFCTEPARIDNPAMGGLQEGVRIAAVAAKSPAELAGFQAGDIVYRIGGQPVNTGEAAVKHLSALRPGEEAVLNFWRNELPFLIRLRG